MKKAIILWGVSGTGKTHARLNDPKLKDLPYIDIADIYRAHPEFDWAEAHIAMRRQVAELLQEH
ncbi:MAG: hypothetical protein GWN58_11200, partial [Anaerolineae bacterium]|nr:hypothetical protein [Anaerolineae bacterium]